MFFQLVNMQQVYELGNMESDFKRMILFLQFCHACTVDL